MHLGRKVFGEKVLNEIVLEFYWNVKIIRKNEKKKEKSLFGENYWREKRKFTINLLGKF